MSCNNTFRLTRWVSISAGSSISPEPCDADRSRAAVRSRDRKTSKSPLLQMRAAKSDPRQNRSGSERSPPRSAGRRKADWKSRIGGSNPPLPRKSPTGKVCSRKGKTRRRYRHAANTVRVRKAKSTFVNPESASNSSSSPIASRSPTFTARFRAASSRGRSPVRPDFRIGTDNPVFARSHFPTQSTSTAVRCTTPCASSVP